MVGLIPAELWDYGLGDLARGLVSSLRAEDRQMTVFIPGLGDCIPTRSARSALVTAIKALELPANASIGVPLYCCAVVFKAIVAAGCRPRFIDIDPATFCMSAVDLRGKASEVDAVIAVHMFGNVCDIVELRKAITGKPIIEDCALSLGSKLSDQPTGSLGDAAVLSFRSGKYLSVGEGGALFSKDEGIRARARQLVSSMSAPDRKEEIIHVINTFLRSSLRSEPLYGVAGYALWEAYNARVAFSAKSPVLEGQIYRTDLSLVKRRLGELSGVIETQRANAEYLEQNLSLDPGMLCHERPNTFYNRYQYPLNFRSCEEREFMATYLHAKGVDTSKPVQDAANVAAAYYDYKGDCPVSERLSQTALVFPAYHSLKKRQVEQVARSLNEGWAEVCSRSSTVTDPLQDRAANDINQPSCGAGFLPDSGPANPLTSGMNLVAAPEQMRESSR